MKPRKTKLPSYRNKQDDCLNRMVDAIREMLGLDPLYSAKNTRYSPHIFNDRISMTSRKSSQ